MVAGRRLRRRVRETEREKERGNSEVDGTIQTDRGTEEKEK